MSKKEQKHPLPIRRWSLRRFKSVEQADLELAPLTLLVGANSSGKSSLIQSILLVTQAAQAGADAVLPLNGPLVELGNFEDVLFAGSSEEPSDVGEKEGKHSKLFRIGAEIDLTAADRLHFHVPEPAEPAGRTPTVSWQASFGSSPKDKNLGAAHLNAVEMILGGNGEVDDRWTFKSTGSRRKKLDVLPTRRYFGAQVGVLQIRGKISQTTADGRWRRGTPGARREMQETRVTAGLVQAGGIPTEFFTEVDRVELEARELLQGLVRTAYRDARFPPARGKSADTRTEKAEAERRLVKVAAAEVVSLMSGGGPPARLPARRREDLWEFLTSFDEHPARAERIIKEVKKAVRSKGSVLCPLDYGRRLPSGADQLGISLIALLKSKVLYLGPLREDPRVLYLSTPGNRQGNVGRKGEKAIALLHAFGDHEVTCPYPDRAPSTCKLTEAVAYWLRHFGIAEEIETELRTRLGLEPHLKLSDVDKPLDMPSVGVGVSQIFPVLVMGLHSQPGSVLLMEQPELHLHPGLQQKLGDFLLACARSGRQLIVETHSDHLISRLRRRIAEDTSDTVCDDVAFVFVERRQGRTQYRRVEVNRLGGIEEWPEGFFDQAAKESQLILRAGLAKKRKINQEKT